VANIKNFGEYGETGFFSILLEKFLPATPF
jgi:hypothetical protein